MLVANFTVLDRPRDSKGGKKGRCNCVLATVSETQLHISKAMLFKIMFSLTSECESQNGFPVLTEVLPYSICGASGN